jgi:hypothetical protein
MKIIYLLLVFGLAFCGTVIPTEVYDIYYNYEYSLVQNYNTKYQYYAFRLPVNGGDKMDIEIKISKFSSQTFSVLAWEYKNYPSVDQVINHDGGYPVDCPTQKYKDYGNYWIYYFTVKADADYKYFAIHVTIPDDDYKTLIFQVDLTKYKYSTIQDLSLNTDYPWDKSIFTDEKIPKDYQIYIRIASFSQDKCEVQLTTDYTYDRRYDFRVDICQYSYKPTQQQVYYGDIDVPCDNDIPNTCETDLHYYFPFETESNVNYLSIRITNNLGDLDNLKIHIYSETGMAVAILVVVIVLPVLAVGGIGYFLYRKFCGGS